MILAPFSTFAPMPFDTDTMINEVTKAFAESRRATQKQFDGVCVARWWQCKLASQFAHADAGALARRD
jgi:hypothetical protein